MKEPLLALETRRIQCAHLDKHYGTRRKLMAQITPRHFLIFRHLPRWAARNFRNGWKKICRDEPETIDLFETAPSMSANGTRAN
jgi:hypothetical protein